MKKENSKKSNSSEENRWINVHDDNVMREMGFLRPFVQSLRDKSVWEKSAYDRKMLKKFRNSGRNIDMHFHTIPQKVIKVRCNLIINLRKNKKFNKTTYSIECWQHEIPFILSKFSVKNKSGNDVNIIRKYSWNGKTYNPNELPFWK